ASDGDWTLRLATAYQTETGRARWTVTFFHVVVGGVAYQTPIPPTPRPTTAPTPAITPAVPCVAPAEGSAPPPISLVIDGQASTPGVNGAFTWFGAVIPPGRV